MTNEMILGDMLSHVEMIHRAVSLILCVIVGYLVIKTIWWIGRD